MVISHLDGDNVDDAESGKTVEAPYGGSCNRRAA